MHYRVQAKHDMLLNMTKETVTKAHAFSYDLQKTESKSITVTPVPSS